VGLKYILLIILFCTHILYTLRVQKKINSTILLNKRQKKLNSIMIWLIPFIWYQLIKGFIHPNPEIMTKKRRNKLIEKNGGEFYESGKGITG